MSQRIKTLKESPCYQCGVEKKCLEKIRRCKCLQEISDYVMPRADFDFHNCSLYKVIKLEENHAKEKNSCR